MPKMTADKLAALWERVKDERENTTMRIERLDLVCLLTSDEAIDQIIAALREKEDRERPRWSQFRDSWDCYRGGNYLGGIRRALDGWNWLPLKGVGGWCESEFEAKLAVEKAASHG